MVVRNLNTNALFNNHVTANPDSLFDIRSVLLIGLEPMIVIFTNDNLKDLYKYFSLDRWLWLEVHKRGI